ncbi:Transglutaminase-like enzymes, putative cysteine protease [Thioalkalivibrio nitratireducens DSM 14787]|uniref:Transglutaminase-like enzymes, putative cysteine protease n=1 Tax=Thioalkalivibrio nitratireducens (strain DSM 14787 / UNIQEM 213 / ALEN2) TaxID=1255043 RepID=L0DV21_THIND|nr:Transglutaminase-like enzymes, putative cysteine protease [Thioalkalivibrio nitratireducens DSM 14787]
MASPMILLLRPHSDTRQWVARDHYAVWPGLPIAEYTDMYGNRCQRLLAPAGSFHLEACSDVQVPSGVEQAPGAPFVEVQDLPAETLMYLAPSRYCESDRLGGLASEITGDCLPGYDQVHAISAWIRRTLAYRAESDPTPVSAVEALNRGDGVCRDFAHLGIALCRSLSIPARMIVGYLHGLEPMDLHAWFEAFVGGRWYVFDPTRATLGGARVCLGHGRDAADVPVFTQFGPPVIPSCMKVSVEEIAGSQH